MVASWTSSWAVVSVVTKFVTVAKVVPWVLEPMAARLGCLSVLAMPHFVVPDGSEPSLL